MTRRRSREGSSSRYSFLSLSLSLSLSLARSLARSLCFSLLCLSRLLMEEAQYLDDKSKFSGPPPPASPPSPWPPAVTRSWCIAIVGFRNWQFLSSSHSHPHSAPLSLSLSLSLSVLFFRD
jgi:hypothetical protein